MTLFITHTGFYLGEGEATVFVDDSTFISISNSRKLQEIILDGRDKISIGRIGIANNVGFWKKDIVADNEDMSQSHSCRKELGYYAKLRDIN